MARGYHFSLIMKLSLVDLQLPYRRFRYLLSFNKTRGDVATAGSNEN